MIVRGTQLQAPWGNAMGPDIATSPADELRLLLVEDDPVVAAEYRLQLELDGYAVDIAASGATALRMATADPPDLVFLDHRLRRRQGLDLVEALRVDERTRSVPIVLLREATRNGAGRTRRG
jgi:two-component system NtrC family sensor kinase